MKRMAMAGGQAALASASGAQAASDYEKFVATSPRDVTALPRARAPEGRRASRVSRLALIRTDALGLCRGQRALDGMGEGRREYRNCRLGLRGPARVQLAGGS